MCQCAREVNTVGVCESRRESCRALHSRQEGRCRRIQAEREGLQEKGLHVGYDTSAVGTRVFMNYKPSVKLAESLVAPSTPAWRVVVAEARLEREHERVFRSVVESV